MIHLHDVEQGSEEWLKLRENLYTGQNAHKLVKNAKALKIVDGKVSAYALNEVAGFAGNFYTKRGHLLEREAIDLYQQITNIEVNQPGFVTNDKYPTCGYSPDGLADDRTIEVKAFNPDKHRESAKELPLEVMAQCHFGMLICDKKFCDVLLYNPDLPAEEALYIITLKQSPLIKANLMRIIGGSK